jgi:hypothetical protein
MRPSSADLAAERPASFRRADFEWQRVDAVAMCCDKFLVGQVGAVLFGLTQP